MAGGVSDEIRAALEKTGIKPEHVLRDPAWPSKHLQDAFLYGQSAARVHRVEKTLADFGDAELVMEMIRRGYAAMKLPEDSGPPEVLRNAQPE